MNREQLLTKWEKPSPVLDDGHVRLVDFMGDDAAIPQAARVSYGAGTKTVREDAQLLRFLMRSEHFSPFAMCQVKLHVRLPIYIHNQWVRHDRFHWNVMSARYSEMPQECWQPEAADVRGQGAGNKQVANGGLEEAQQAEAANIIGRTYHQIKLAYRQLLDMNVGREQARTVLPMGQYTEAYVTANLGDWLLFLKQRLNPHAQYEIRVYAEAVYAILADLFPVTMEAFMDYEVGGVRFSAQEMSCIRSLLNGELGVRLINEAGQNVETGASYYEVGTSRDTALAKATRPKDLNKEQRQSLLQKFLPTKRERQEFWKKISG